MWDDFAIACGASFRCSFLGARLWGLEHSLQCRVRYFELFLVTGPQETKIGQCAVACSSRQTRFLDQIQLAPSWSDRWCEAMQSVLSQVKSTSYIYGSEWGLDRPREHDLASLPGIEVIGTRPLDVQLVDFASWPSWADYERAISDNVKRCSRRSGKLHRDATVAARRGLSAFLDLRKSAAYRSELFQRKGLRRNLAAMVIRSAFRIVATRPYAQSVRLIHAGRTMAFYHAVDFGTNTFYLEGSAVRPDDGAQWRLLLSMLKAAHSRSGGQGKFVMGPADARPNLDPTWQGLLRSRQACRTRDHATSVVTFRRRPAMAALATAPAV